MSPLTREERLQRKREAQRVYYKANRERELERQRIYRETGPERRVETARRYAQANRKEQNARQAAWRAAERGDLEREPCLFCDAPETEAHHHDYDRPLEVTWLCRYHHKVIHRQPGIGHQSVSPDRNPSNPSAGATPIEPVNRASFLSEDLDEYNEES